MLSGKLSYITKYTKSQKHEKLDLSVCFGSTWGYSIKMVFHPILPLLLPTRFSLQITNKDNNDVIASIFQIATKKMEKITKALSAKPARASPARDGTLTRLTAPSTVIKFYLFF